MRPILTSLLARFGGLFFAGVMKYLPAMESNDEFKKLLDSFIEAMRNQHERSFGFRELGAFLLANIGDDALSYEQEAAVFKHFGDHYDLRRWPFSEPRWSFIEG
jgi:hypothetical protein